MYAFTFQDTPYTPSGPLRDSHGAFLPASEVDAYNRSVESQEIARLKTHPAHVFLYVRQSGTNWQIRTWLGTVLDSHVHIGPRRYIGFGHGTYRRPVTCCIFGALYHGWYMESSGDYCRLRKAKRQRLDELGNSVPTSTEEVRS